MKEKIIFITSTREFEQTIFHDLKNESELDFIENPEKFRNILWHIGYWLCNKIFGKKQRFFYRDFFCSYNNALIDYNFDKNKKYIICFTNAALEQFPKSYLLKIQNQYNIDYVLVLLDTLSMRASQVAKDRLENISFKKIYTIDKNDAKKYNFYFTQSIYSVLKINKSVDTRKNDLFFIGNDKGRRCVIEKIYQEGIKRGVLCDFTLNCVLDMEQKDGIKYNNYVEYQNVVNNILYSNCILEVVQPGQNGVTLRYYEAVCYNKKLLTNNKEIVHYPYYDRRYMKIFDSIEEIDYDWIIQEDNIQYNYNGEFSPTMLIRDILSEE